MKTGYVLEFWDQSLPYDTLWNWKEFGPTVESMILRSSGQTTGAWAFVPNTTRDVAKALGSTQRWDDGEYHLAYRSLGDAEATLHLIERTYHWKWRIVLLEVELHVKRTPVE